MDIIEIRVTPFTRHMLLHEHGPEPIRFSKGDLMLNYLRCTSSSSGYSPRTFRWLSTTVRIAVDASLARVVAKKNNNAGIALFNYHREVMLRYIDALYSTGIPAREAMFRFYNHYQLSEWEYSTEAAYRRWVDFKRETGKKRPLAVSRISEAVITPLDSILIEQYDAVLLELSQHQKRAGKLFVRQLKCYIIYSYGRHTLTKTGLICGCSKSAVHRAVLSITLKIQRDRFLSKTLKARFEEPLSLQSA